MLCRYDRSDLSPRKRAALEVETVFLSIIKSWVANLGMSSYGALKIRDVAAPAYGQYQWDLVGPSYLNVLSGFFKGTYKHGFVVADIILDKIITKNDIKPFFFKIDSLSNQKKILPFIAIFIADMFSPEALKLLRKKGIIIARPDTILGEDNANLIKSLIDTLENASRKIAENPEDIFLLLKKLSKIEGASLNLRSVILDFIIAKIFSLEGFACDIRQKIQLKNGDRAEVDVIASRMDKVVFIEGKALSPGNQLDTEEIQEWIRKTYPKIRKFVKENGNYPLDTSIELCVSTSFHDNSANLIVEMQKKFKKMPINFTNGTHILDRLRKFRLSSISDLFREHFT